MECPNCGGENRPERRFCTHCGAALQAACPACGAASETGDAFCGECGSALTVVRADPRATARDADRGSVSAPTTSPSATSVSEIRHVAVLFCDLVGFTSFSESRDPEDVRELLSRYFDLARSIVDRYGGTIEKFIGDAVMAVWGVPGANEDDAERAVRAALDLVAAVERLGASATVPSLVARAGVLSGDAAVTLGAAGQGMVAGDLVNTASRLQSVAEPGTVLVGEATYLSARDAVAFADDRELSVKGKETPVRAWRAVRVVAQRRGAGRSGQLEPPFVGRGDQLRLLADLLHTTSRERKARLVSVTGIAGIGKSRLAWELLKYVDGLAETVFWHHGRSPAYGEGISFWALAEMVRMRARISELDDAATSRKKLAAVVEEHVELADERRWIEPCLAHLLGLSEPTAQDRQELFSAWRTFFERIAEHGTVVMVFEDLQWADGGLVDFVESVVEWSRSHPILVVTLSRPELVDRRPTWGAATRDFISLHLDPLDDAAMRDLLHGLIRGLPADVADALVRRAEGVPLHAVETVRALVDRGVIVQLDDGYELLGEVTDLELPDSLQALITSRLDTLPQAGRSLLQDAAVLGKTFTSAALAAVAQTDEAATAGTLRDLVRREFLVVDSDPRSPERGQFGFVQAVVREVAYGTLSKRDRRAKHLTSARYFETADDEELAGLVAAHYLEAYRATGGSSERAEVGALATRWLERAARRALSLGSTDQALVYAQQALEVAATGPERATLLCLAAKTARMALKIDTAIAHAREALALSEEAGDPVGAGRAVIELIDADFLENEQFHAGLGKGLETYPLLPERGAEEVVADLAMGLSMAYHGLGDHQSSLEWSERAIRVAERMDDVKVFGRALGCRASALFSLGRHREAAIIERGSVAIADETSSVHDQAMGRLLESLYVQDDDPRRALRVADESAELARRAGDRNLELTDVLNAIEMALLIGDWDSARARLSAIATGPPMRNLQSTWKDILVAMLDGVTSADHAPEASLDRLQVMLEQNEYVHMRTTYLRGRAFVSLARGDLDRVRAEVRALVAADPEGINTVIARAMSGRAAVWQRDAEGAREALEGMASFHGRATLAARATIGAGLAALERSGVEAAASFREAAALWRQLDVPLDLALCGMDAARLLGADDRPAELVEETQGILRALDATPLLAQLEQHVAAVTSAGA